MKDGTATIKYNGSDCVEIMNKELAICLKKMKEVELFISDDDWCELIDTILLVQNEKDELYLKPSVSDGFYVRDFEGFDDERPTEEDMHLMGIVSFKREYNEAYDSLNNKVWDRDVKEIVSMIKANFTNLDSDEAQYLYSGRA
jgi:hypothetical protein